MPPCPAPPAPTASPTTPRQVLRELHRSCQTEDGRDDTKKGTQLLEIYALEIQLHSEQRNSKKLKELYQVGGWGGGREAGAWLRRAHWGGTLARAQLSACVCLPRGQREQLRLPRRGAARGRRAARGRPALPAARRHLHCPAPAAGPIQSRPPRPPAAPPVERRRRWPSRARSRTRASWASSASAAARCTCGSGPGHRRPPTSSRPSSRTTRWGGPRGTGGAHVVQAAGGAVRAPCLVQHGWLGQQRQGSHGRMDGRRCVRCSSRFRWPLHCHRAGGQRAARAVPKGGAWEGGLAAWGDCAEVAGPWRRLPAPEQLRLMCFAHVAHLLPPPLLLHPPLPPPTHLRTYASTLRIHPPTHPTHPTPRPAPPRSTWCWPTC